MQEKIRNQKQNIFAKQYKIAAFIPPFVRAPYSYVWSMVSNAPRKAVTWVI